VDRVEIECRSRFHVSVPRDLDELARLEAVRDAFDAWLRERALKDARAFARRYQTRLGVEAAGVRIGNQRRSWGTCGKDGIVRINWRLIQAPAAAMEYVVAHEVCHLAERHHGPAFWDRLGVAMPDWRERKAALEGWEGEHLVV
jgi:predicted metal-dependent hydrolase